MQKTGHDTKQVSVIYWRSQRKLVSANYIYLSNPRKLVSAKYFYFGETRKLVSAKHEKNHPRKFVSAKISIPKVDQTDILHNKRKLQIKRCRHSS